MWNHIAKSLERHAEKSTNRVSALNLAFCYSFGFGVYRDKEQVKARLEKSQLSSKDLEAERCMLDPTVWKFNYESQKVRSWAAKGYFTAFDHFHAYRRTGSLEVIRTDYINFIRDSEEEFRQDHFVPLSQKEVLSRILEAERKYLEQKCYWTRL